MPKPQEPRRRTAQAPQCGSGDQSSSTTVALDGERVIAHRKTLGLSHAMLASQSGVSEDTISRAEKGTPIRLGLASTLASAFKVDLQALLPSSSPLEIIFDPTNPGRKFWSVEPMKDENGKPIPGSFWEYRAIVRNNSSKTVRNVKVVVEAVGLMPTRPEPSHFDINKRPLIDLTPHEEALAILRRWFNPPIVAGMATGEGIYGPIRMTASADDVLPVVAFFQFDPMRTPMIYELKADAD
jgi:DNA-binding XRE family transcriptional regulator